MKKEDSNIKIGAKSFIIAAVIIFILMIATGILTRVLPAGEYIQTETENVYRELSERPSYPVWRWFTAPVEVLFGSDNLILIVLIVFITVVGGSITVLDNAGVLKTFVNFLVARFAKRKYMLIVVMIFFFMSAASFVGVYEEMIPLIIFIVPVAISLGWDSLTGLGMSLLPLAFGFAAAVTNPLTIAVAQKIAGLPLFSGAPYQVQRTSVKAHPVFLRAFEGRVVAELVYQRLSVVFFFGVEFLERRQEPLLPNEVVYALPVQHLYQV